MAENGNVLDRRNVLIPVDDTEDSEKAVSWCLENFHRSGDEIHILHIVPIPMPEVVGGLGGVEGIVTIDPDPADDVKHIEQAREFLHHRFVPLLEGKGAAYKLEVVRYMVDADSIGEAVVKRANAINAAAIIIASHNKNALRQFFLGSVSNYTTQHAKQAVIVLH